MGHTEKETTVMFADIAGSTRLYEAMGDEKAEALISNTLKQLSIVVTSFHGKIIKTIGDELMCRFPRASDAISAAKIMHESLAEKTTPSGENKLSIRVGAHQGSVVENDGDIFGDTVNIAARVTALARAGKTMITGYTYEQLTGSSRESCQRIMRTSVKGKEQPIDVYDVIWEQTEELTCIIDNVNKAAVEKILAVRYGDDVIRMSANTVPRITVGRGKECNLVVPSPQASRKHCKIECNRGKFIFSDNSANGSHVKQNQIELFFHQEQVPLLVDGTISLGEPAADNHDFLLHYSISLADTD